MTTFTATLQSFFTIYLVGQKAASGHTISAYRDTVRLLLLHIRDTTGTTPDVVEFTDVNAETITAFLTYLETVRHNTIRTRNARLAGLHAFFAYAAYRHPEHADIIARVLAIKSKNTATTILSYLTNDEVDALLNAPDRSTATGRRDYVIILVFVTTGLRVSELTALRRFDLHLDQPAHLLCHGKGRKDRITPLNNKTTRALREWLTTSPDAHAEDLIFTAQGHTTALGRDAIAARLRIYCATAATTCPSLVGKNVTPHTLRHTTAMRMLAAGVDITTISLWLGHESTQATQAYIHADLAMKERAMARIAPIGTAGPRFVPTGQLLAFLEAL